MKTQKLSYLFIAASILVTTLVTSCKKSSTDPAYTAPTGTAPSTAITGIQLTNNAKFGSILTDNAGRSLYFFGKDAAVTSNCTDAGCAMAWPLFYKANPSIGTGLAASDFGVITRADGLKQNTYKGWPLYYYITDAKAGDTNGDGVGSIWVVAKTDYSVMVTESQLIGGDGVNYLDQGIAGVGASFYLSDPTGHTLYQFKSDTHNTNNFTSALFGNDSIWPIDYNTTVGSIPSMLDKTQFGIITIQTKTQLAYKGHPLYYFGKDNFTPGLTNGVSVPTPGAGIWKVLNSNTPVL